MGIPSNMAASAKALRISSHLKELRIHLCQKSASSQGVREFIEKNYVGIKQNNPRFPILVRECSGVQPRMWARYDLGQESSLPLSDLSSAEVMEAMEKLATKPA